MLEIITVNDKEYLLNDKEIKKGIVVIDMSNQCDFYDLNILPVKIIAYEDYKDKYIICKHNIVVGEI